MYKGRISETIIKVDEETYIHNINKKNDIKLKNKNFKKFIKGAFSETIVKNPKVWLMNDHKDYNEVLGITHLKEDHFGNLLIKAHFNLFTQIGRDAFNLIKDGYEKGLEPSFSIQGWHYDLSECSKDDNVIICSKMIVREVSIVLVPNNKKAQILKIQ